jgi:L-fuculose-phosphate aldolase
MPDIQQLKERICEIGRRVYAKNFVAANEGNISTRVDDQTVLCTPTLHCKGFMEPDDICLVDFSGHQLAGKRKRTSEVFLHLEIYKQRPDVKHIVHCHPPHATAFAIAREPIPNGILPEPDIFLGEVPIAAYETPGNQNFAETILPFINETNIIVLANHGTVSFDADLEQAYWYTEILDAYCRTLILAKQLGRIEYLPIEKVRELLALRKEWGFQDSRSFSPDANENIADFASFKSTWPNANIAQRAFPSHPSVSNEIAQDPIALQLDPKDLDALADKIAQRLKQV